MLAKLFKNMCRKTLYILLVFLAGGLSSFAQKIYYSEPDREDMRSLNFEVAGKIDNNYLIYKNLRSTSYISVLNNEMEETDKIELEFMPDKVLNTDVISYRDYFYLIYQYQKRNIVYCMAAKINGAGKIMGDPVQLDTTAISFFASNKIYSVLNSEDKQKILILKINTRDEDVYHITENIFDAALTKLSSSKFDVGMPERSDFLSEFTIDNEGTLIFLRMSGSQQNDAITKANLFIRDMGSTESFSHDVKISEAYLDDIRLKCDNYNKNYLVTSLYSKTRRGNIDGVFCMLWDKKDAKEITSTYTLFTDEMRNNAKSDGGPKIAFNDFFMQNILMRRDGGFAIATENVYSSTRGSAFNRWDNMWGSPFYSPYGYYSWNSSYYGFYPWNRWGSSFQNQVNRYFADNIFIMSFDSSATLQWNNIVHKSQYDDYTDNFIGYGTFNSGSEIHFLFNQLEKRTLLLSDHSVTPDGQITRSPTLRNLSKDYQFMPRFAKQVASREIIVPCQFRNYVCFAKIEF